MLKNAKFAALLVVLASSVVGCAPSNDLSVQTGSTTAPDATYLLADKPVDVKGVAQAREESQDDEVVTVEGRIGGSEKPFIDRMAAFTIVDPKLAWCADDEGCPTPWDYCCADKTGKVAMVKIVAADGQPVTKDARELLGVKELSKVVVRGKAKRDEQGNLTVLAEKVHVAVD